ncbi:MAG: hypothetical protein H6734_04785 [Alphaproteobacteria bacterium]|nr:hypothetical protein [Alphaproteobacteria bacterium]
MKVRFLADGKLSADVTRAGVARKASGKYTMDGNDATFVMVESGGGATYSGKFSASGATGRYSTPDGEKGRLKVKR